MSFADQALIAEWLWKGPKLTAKVYNVPSDIDAMVARLKLESMGVGVDKLTEQQLKYMSSWKEGTT